MNEIKIKVGLDENKVPSKILWQADEQQKESDARAFLLSVWDTKTANTLKVDLWTKEMSVDDMKKFYFQTLVTMADTFERSTGEDSMANAMRDFADFFGEKFGIIPSSGKFDQ